MIFHQIYIVMEYVHGDLLYDVCKQNGGMGEETGRFFLNQLLDAIEHMHEQTGIVHRDLKLENIIVDPEWNMKLIDFGFSSSKNISNMKSYKGTMSYMAPEIKANQPYDGKQIDIFSTGIILFIIVNGIFPFAESKPTDYHYKFLLNKDYETFWDAVRCSERSNAFKDLIHKMLSNDPSERPTLEQIRKHPFMAENQIFEVVHQSPCDKCVSDIDKQSYEQHNSSRSTLSNGSSFQRKSFEEYKEEYNYNQHSIFANMHWAGMWSFFTDIVE